MALSGISPYDHNRLLDKLTRRTDNDTIKLAHYKSLEELYERYNGLIIEIQKVIQHYEEVAAPVRSRTYYPAARVRRLQTEPVEK